MNDRILVPLDGSPFAEQVLPLARMLARRWGMPLLLVRVHRLVPGGYGEETMLAAMDFQVREHDAAGAYLDRMARSLAERGTMRVETELLDGASAGDAIARCARQSGASMIVMTTHGRTGILRTVRGSVADAVVRHATVPVLLWRPSDPPVPPPERVAHLLAPLDGSTHAETVLPHVAALGGLLHARITLLRVVPHATTMPDPPPVIPFSAYAGVGTAMLVVDQPATDRLVQRAREELSATAERMRREWPALALQVRVVIDDSAAATIARIADEISADLVVLATHGRGASRLVVGSTVDDVMRLRAGATLLLRPPPAVEGT